MKNHVLIYMMFAYLLLFGSCSSPSEIPEGEETATTKEGTFELTSKQFQSSGMELGKLEMAPFHQVVKAIGKFDVPPENNAAVSSYFAGPVIDIRLLP